MQKRNSKLEKESFRLSALLSQLVLLYLLSASMVQAAFFFFFHSFGIRIKRSFPANPIAIAKKKTTAVLLLLLLFPIFYLQSPLNFWNERKVLKSVGVGSRGTLRGHWKKLTHHCLWITFYFNLKWTFGGYWTRREKDRSILEGQKKAAAKCRALRGYMERESVFCILLGYPFWSTMSHTRNAGAGVVVWERRRL